MLSPRDVIRLTLTIATSPGESWRLVEALGSLMEPTRADNGCVGCELALFSKFDEAPNIRYVEDWSSEEDLRKRVRSDRFLQLIAVMEEALSRPEIAFELVSGTRGLDYVVDARRDLIRHE